MSVLVLLSSLLLCSVFSIVNSKVYKRCELARELQEVYEIPQTQLATWLCISNYESHYNTSAHNSGTGDHGLFQISELYWCSPPGVGLACGVSCADLKDDDIEDDVICARRIFRQHQRLTGDGFNAWAVYKLHCSNKEHRDTFLKGCFDTKNANSTAPQKEDSSKEKEKPHDQLKNMNDLNSNEAEVPKHSVQVKCSGRKSKAPISLLILREKPQTVSRQKKAKSFKKSATLDDMEAEKIPITTVSKHTIFKPTIHLLT
ncbi:hypothetical protein RI129_011234 [Pyrocoelia pectoralis]|uniref:lysozyme n=1 Tax=Pyrocoelia pectoralis TaxID=417401 RepID=A0AAN7V536_9COLE